MQSASRESLLALRDSLPTANPESLASDLRAFAGLLTDEPALRRALTDPARAPQAREDLASQLLSGKIGSDALSVAKSASKSRWSSALDLLTAVELLAVDAELALADNTGVLGDVEDELFRFGRIVAANPQLAGVLGASNAAIAPRAALVESLLAGKAHAITVRLATFALTGLGGRAFDAALSRIVEEAAARRDRKVAYVTSATPLSDAQIERISRRLGQVYGRSISVRVDADPSLIGGVTIRVGDDLYDGSVSRRLENARTNLGA
ncbi:MAG: F0F1 ATP synthase subunit delta [Corynebacteriales bacterium]|nr:F0F1 ATP synthase subunit delta [Mycobacteriales bacterium]